jgi:glycosyltransferase involved in cell wall biosynthesis
MKISGITRVRDEEHIIKDTINHVKSLGVSNIYVYDDCSTDNTPDICESLGCKVVRGTEWASDPHGRNQAEGNLRTVAYKEALKDNPDWVYCFDADEFADFDGIDWKADAYKLRLFDFYITEEDKHLSYKDRQWMGEEYRDILMLFRASPLIKFFQRQPRIPEYYNVVQGGWVKHYGKAVSIEEWEKTCDYYINNRGGSLLPQFTDKWSERKGKAIHTQSDFGNKLIKWEDRYNGVPMDI